MSAPEPTTPPAEHWVEQRTGITPTAHPEVRLSARQVLDEGSRPTAPEPSAPAAYSALGRAIGSHLVDVHEHYRAELSQVRQALREVSQGAQGVADARSAINAMTMRANDWALGGICQAHCQSLTLHHSMESDSIFPHLRRRQPDLAPVLDRLHDEHLAIHAVLEEIDAALVHLVQHPTDFTRISEAIDLLTDTLLSHFAYEERELVAPLASHGFYPGQV